MKTFLSVAAALIVVLGGAWLFFPEAMLGRWGVQTDAVGLFMGRRYGTMLLGFRGGSCDVALPGASHSL